MRQNQMDPINRPCREEIVGNQWIYPLTFGNDFCVRLLSADSEISGKVILLVGVSRTSTKQNVCNLFSVVARYMQSYKSLYGVVLLQLRALNLPCTQKKNKIVWQCVCIVCGQMCFIFRPNHWNCSTIMRGPRMEKCCVVFVRVPLNGNTISSVFR